MGAIEGFAEPGFAAVRTAFENGFERHGDVGAGVCVYWRGRCVVDLWGGVADLQTERPWTQETPVVVFSTTKGATAVCANLLAERGELDLDAPVADYWPEFAAEGKKQVPVRWLLSHRSGLAALDELLTVDEVCAWDPVVEALAAQRPLWEPGSEHGYHALTFGWLVGEVVRRVSGKPIGRFFADEVADPLGLEWWIGLPKSHHARVAPLIPFGVPAAQSNPQLEAFMREALLPRALTLSGTMPADAFNLPQVWSAEIPAAGGVATARGVARMYAALVGEVDGVRILPADAVARACREQAAGPDKVLIAATCFGQGFMRPAQFTPFGGPASFGHPGAGGSVGWADPDAELAIGYVMNKMQANLSGDPRMVGVIEAAYASIGDSV